MEWMPKSVALSFTLFPLLKCTLCLPYLFLLLERINLEKLMSRLNYVQKDEKKDLLISLQSWVATIITIRKQSQFSSVQSLSRARLCHRMNCSTPGLPVHHQLLEFTQTHIHRVSDAIQPSHPLSSPSPPAPSTSQHQSLFQWVNSLHEVAKVLELQL